jgi:fatty-acyl-CoA synthase
MPGNENPMTSMFDQGLPKNAANFASLSPISFAERAADVFGHRLAVVHGKRRYTWRQTLNRSRALAAALAAAGVEKNDCVALMLANTPEMVEAHYAIPGMNAVMLPLNIRLDAPAIAFMLNHSKARVLITDCEFAAVMGLALASVDHPVLIVDVCDSEYAQAPIRLGTTEYEAFLQTFINHAPPLRLPDDEWDAIALAYTSGTTGDPKGVVTHHRGAYLNASSNIITWAMPHHPVYLWTLPMFHCNGWCFPWTIAAMAGTHVCLRRVDPAAIFALLSEHQVTHYCGAPIVHNTMINYAQLNGVKLDSPVKAMVAGAAPPAAMIEGLERLGISVSHVYGLTEVYGPAVGCPQQADWHSLPIGERATLNARQGVRYPMAQAVDVLDPETMKPVPNDGTTIGEVMFKGNLTMKGYLKNEAATSAAFAGGYFHSGDLAVVFPDGYLKIKDRSKDVIISGGENISSIEIEDVLYRHPAVLFAAVVAKPDAKWGETPCAFIELKANAQPSVQDVIDHCKQHLAGFKVPKAIVFGELPKTSTGKIQKFLLRDRVGSVAAFE